MAETNAKAPLISKGTGVTVGILVILAGLAFVGGQVVNDVSANTDAIDELPEDYVPRTEVELRLKSIDDSTARIEADVADIEAAVKE